jgi:hypothetical protein
MRLANYKTHPLPVYAGNPLIETLDIIKHPSGLEGIIAEPKIIPADIMSYDPYLGQSLIGELEDAYIPHPNAWHIYKQLTQQIMAGYRNRNPATSSGQRFQNKILVMCQNGENVELDKFMGSAAGTARCSLSTGLSGTGKTETLRRILRCIPQKYQHSKVKSQHQNFDQLVWVSFDVTSSNSLKGLASNFYRAVDQAVGTSYQDEYPEKGLGVDTHINCVRKICARHYIGLVHVDECQHLLKRISNPNNATLDHLESLFNRIGVPMLTTCTPEGLRLFFDQDLKNAKLQSTRRLMSDRIYDFSPMEKDSLFYKAFFGTYLPENVFQNTAITSQPFRDIIHFKTFGLQAISRHLMRLFFEAVQSKPEFLEGEKCFDLLDMVYQQHFGATSLAIEELRKNKAQRYEAERAAIQQAEARIAMLQFKEQNQAGNSPRTMHSSRLAPKMANTNSLLKLAALDKRLANVIDANPLLTGFAEAHQ